MRKRVRSSDGEEDWWGMGKEPLLREGVLAVGGGTVGLVGCVCDGGITTCGGSWAVRSASLVSAENQPQSVM